MDQRNDLPPDQVQHGQIREGAGLDESRINQDFVDFLRKFSTPFLLIILIAAAAYFGLNYYREIQARALDTAFLELDEAMRAGSPDSLVAVATAHQGQRAVSSLARLNAADIHLAAARTRVAVAAPLNPDGTPQNEADILGDEQRNDQLQQAGALYQRVLDDAASSTPIAINAMFGLAAVAETRGDMETAATWYTRIAERASGAGLARLATIANERKASLDAIKDPPSLYTVAQLPAAPISPASPLGPTIVDDQGNPITMQRIDGPPPGMDASGQPLPMPAPAPVDPAAPAPNPADSVPEAPGAPAPKG